MAALQASISFRAMKIPSIISSRVTPAARSAGQLSIELQFSAFVSQRDRGLLCVAMYTVAGSFIKSILES